MKFSFYSKPAYYADLLKRFVKSGKDDRIVLMTMGFDPNLPEVQQLVNELCYASKRGTAISLFVDWQKSKSGRSAVRTARQKAFDQLTQAGAKVLLINKVGRRLRNIYAGRSHIKLAIINDRLYVGGCNLDWMEQIDMMVGWDDPKTAGKLVGFAEKLAKTEDVKLALDGQDLSLQIDSKTRLLIDAGVRRQSLIYDHALRLISRAKQYIVASFYFFPNARTRKHLSQAVRSGTELSFWYNYNRKHLFPHNLIQAIVGSAERLRLGLNVKASRPAKHRPLLHAKMLATENETIVGSHNFAPSGVKWGTAEIALHSRDPEFAEAAIAVIEKQLA